MTQRAALAADLKKHLPRAWSVKPYRYSIDNLRAPAVMVGTSRIAKADGKRDGRLLTLHEEQFAVTVFVAETAPEKRDDAIEDAAARLVLAVEQLGQNGAAVRWDDVSFDTAENYPSADVTVTVLAKHDLPPKTN